MDSKKSSKINKFSEDVSAFSGPPAFSSAATSVDGTTIAVVLSCTTAPILPATGNIPGWTVKENGLPYAISGAQIQGSGSPNNVTIVLTLSSLATIGKTYTVAYDPAFVSPVVTDSSTPTPLPLAAFGHSTGVVTNNTCSRVPPVVTSAISDNEGTYVTVTFSENISPSSPSGLTLSINSVPTSITVTKPTSNTYKLTLTGGFFDNSQTVKLSYVVPGSNKIVDTQPIPNQLQAFSNMSVVNNGPDITPPVFSTGTVSADGKTLTLSFVDSTSPLQPTNPTGFYIYVNGINQVYHSVVLTGGLSYVFTLNDPIHPGDSIKVAYIASEGNVSDSAPVLTNNPSGPNFMADFGPTNVINTTVAINTTFFDILAWSQSETDAVAGDLFERRLGYPLASILLDTTPPLANILIKEDPGTGGMKVHEFSVYGSTTFSPDSGSAITDDLIDNVNAYYAIQFRSEGIESITNIGVQLKASAALSNGNEKFTAFLYSDANGTPGVRLATASTSIPFSAITESYQVFTLSLNYLLSNTTLYWIVLQRSAPPLGGSIYNAVYATDDNGVLSYSPDGITWSTNYGKQGYYQLTGKTSNSLPLSGITELEDDFGQPIREAVFFGGGTEPDTFETIGISNVRAITRYLDPISLNTYPSVISLLIGATANKAKDYIVEVMTSPGGIWHQLYTIIANIDTLDFFTYTFTTAVPLYAVRMRYLGDYYAASETADITISAQDPLTSTVAAQFSHYPDFHDAADFPGADSSGWVSISDGTSFFPWSLINNTRTWQATGTPASGSIRHIEVFSVGLVIATSNQLYLLPSGGNMTLEYTISSPGVTINRLAVYRGQLYVGLSNGIFLVTTGGQSYSPVNNGNPLPPILGMTPFNGKLWISTAAGTDGQSTLYTWDGTNLVLIRKFVQTIASDLVAQNGYLYVALGGAIGLNTGTVYQFDGTSWTQTLKVNSDLVEALGVSTATGNVYAGAQGGTLMQLAFTSGVPSAWSTAYNSDATHFYHLEDDPSGQFFWACTDTGLLSYVQSKGSFYPVTLPSVRSGGLQAIWTNSNVSNYKQLGLGNSKVVVNDGPINWTNLTASRPAGVNATYINASWRGFIQAAYTQSYTFYADANDGVRLYVGGEIVIDAWIDQTGIFESTGTIGMVAGQWVPILIEFYAGNNSNPGIELYWSSTSVSKQLVPSSHLGLPNLIQDIGYMGILPYGGSDDEYVYALDSTDIGTTKRVVYSRYKDAAGNVTPLPGITDSIIQDSEVINGVKVSDGRIFQVNNDKTVEATFASNITSALYAPDRRVREIGIYESDPFNVVTLTHWLNIDTLANYPAGSGSGFGLDEGVQIDVYVKVANTREDCINASYGNAFTYSTIGNSGNATVGYLSNSFDISTLSGPWLQFKVVLTSATRGVTPTLRAVTLSYMAANASYFFSTMFDTSSVSNVLPVPQIRRGLLTANYFDNGGQIMFGYTTDNTPGSTFDFSQYTIIKPNTVFELASPSEMIRFGILLVSLTGDPAVVDEFAVQLDDGPTDLKWVS